MNARLPMIFEGTIFSFQGKHRYIINICFVNTNLMLCVLFAPVRAAEPVDEQQDDEAEDEDRDDDDENQQGHVQT